MRPPETCSEEKLSADGGTILGPVDHGLWECNLYCRHMIRVLSFLIFLGSLVLSNSALK